MCKKEKPQVDQPKEKRKYNYTMKTGRPTKYKPEYCQDIIDYFDKPLVTQGKKQTVVGVRVVDLKCDVVQPPLFLCDYAKKIGVETSTLWEWGQTYPEFSKALKRVDELQERMFVAQGSVGNYTPYITGLVLRNKHGWRDKVDHSLTGANDGAIKVEQIKDIENMPTEDLLKVLQERAIKQK